MFSLQITSDLREIQLGSLDHVDVGWCRVTEEERSSIDDLVESQSNTEQYEHSPGNSSEPRSWFVEAISESNYGQILSKCVN